MENEECVSLGDILLDMLMVFVVVVMIVGFGKSGVGELRIRKDIEINLF